MDELIETIRKIESLFLPLLPRKWHHPPPSYRVVIPLLKKIGRYEKRFLWVEPLLDSIRTEIYPPYHEDVLGTKEMTKDEMNWTRFILAVVGFVLAMSFTGIAPLLSPWIKGSLLFAGSVLFIYGAMHSSISALWAVWGFLFPLIAALGIGPAPWAMAFLAFCSLLWHMPALKKRSPWHWYDVLCTFPILFFWVGNVSKMLPHWFLWQKGLLFLVLWLSIWMILIGTKNSSISKGCQFFWPASLTVIAFIILIQPKVSGLPRFCLWLLGTLGLSLGMSKLAPRISTWSYLYRWMTIMLVFALYALFLLVRGTPSQLKETIDTAFLHLFYSIELLWWVVGAGIILSVHGMTVMLLKWIQALLHRWILPLSVWILPVLAYGMGWFNPLIGKIGKPSAAGLWIAFTLGVTLLAWRRKEYALREWMFWGLFLFFLFQQYWSDAQRAIDLYWNQATLEGTGFIILAIWLLWLNYYSMGKYLGRLREKAKGIGAVAILGATLWFMVAFLWMSYVDQQFSFSIRGRIYYDLLKGFTFMGVPLIMYHLIMGQYLKKNLSKNLPWPWIVIMGFGLSQILQGIEHSVVARLEHQTLDALQKKLLETLLSGVPLDGIAPERVMNFSWMFLWRVIRWAIAMLTLSWAIRYRNRTEWGSVTFVLTFCFTSLGVWTAEAIWLFWPSLPLEWAVILRPWVQTTLMWDGSSFGLYLLYLFAGLLWGWVFSKIRISKNESPIKSDETRP